MTSMPVGIWQQSEARYPVRPPYAPPARFPELRYEGDLDPDNGVYASVRELFRLMGFDAAGYGTPNWNPLGWLVKPGETVFLKPNMISHRHRLRNEWEYVITHGSVIRAVADYVVIALGREGRLIIGDAPQTDSLWEGIVEHMGLVELKTHYEALGVPMELLDLRDEHHVDKDGIYVATRRLPGDPRGGVAVDLARDSMFTELDGRGKRYYGAYYDENETNEHQRDGRHEYYVSRSPLMADVFLNLPKLKTHKKCGLTVNLKSLVGINANKNWLPHYVFGAPANGGDQFDALTLKTRLENAIVRPAKQLLLRGIGPFQMLARRTKRIGYGVFGDTEDVVRSGNWHGNDTVWRMSLDLNRILMYANEDGTMREGSAVKRYFSVVDGIVGMEGNGPVAGTPREAGLLIGGANPVAVDVVCARLMGLDPDRLPIIRRAWGSHRYPLATGSEADVAPLSNVTVWNRPLASWRSNESLRFRPHFGWVSHVEWEPESAPRA